MIDKVSATDKISSKQQEKEFWKDKNERCLKCQCTCKQSSKVSVLNCPKYVAKEKGV